MARDVEFNVTASDRTGNALSSAERRIKASQDKMRRDAESSLGTVGKSLLRGIESVAPGVARSITRGITSATEAAGPVLAGIAVVAAPAIAATLSAAVVGGAGIGGVVGGVMLAARDPRVAAAGAALGEQVMGSLTEAAAPFTEATLGAIAKIRTGFQQVEGNLRSIFANSAKFVGPLTEGAIGFGQAMVRAWDVIVSKAGPVIAAIRDGLTQTGESFGAFLTTVAGDGKAAAAALRNVVDLVTGLLAVLGPTIAALSTVYEWLDRIGAAGGLLQAIAKVGQLGEHTGELTRRVAGAADGFVHANAAAADYAYSLDAASEASRRNIAEQAGLFGATTTAAQALRDARKAVDEHGKSMSLNTEAGIANRQTLSNLATALNGQYDAYVAVNGAGNKANDVMQANRNNFIAVARQAGLSAAAANRLADELIGIPDRRPKVELLDNASGKINNVINRLAAVKSKSVTINIAVRQSGDAAALRKQDQTSVNSYAGHTYARGDAGQHRVGGPAPVAVSTSVAVNLDGAPFRAQTTRVVNDALHRERWRSRVGVK